MGKFLSTLMWVMFSIFIGYIAAGLLSTYLKPSSVYLLSDTISFATLPVIFVGIPYAIIQYALSFLSPEALNPTYLVPSLSLVVFVVGMWLNNSTSVSISVNQGEYYPFYVSIAAIAVFAVVYSVVMRWLIAVHAKR